MGKRKRNAGAFDCFQVYLDDSLGERIWVDRPDCRLFVENVMTAFNSKLPTISMMATDATVTKGESVAGELKDVQD